MANVIYRDGQVRAVELDKLVERKTIGDQVTVTAFAIRDDYTYELPSRTWTRNARVHWTGSITHS